MINRIYVQVKIQAIIGKRNEKKAEIQLAPQRSPTQPLQPVSGTDHPRHAGRHAKQTHALHRLESNYWF